jgi:hypothetical protein
MFTFIRMLLVAGRLLLAALALVFQTTVDPSGHWEGTIKVPNMDAKIEIDLQKNSKGEMAGTFGHPAEALKGLPLAAVTVEGTAVTLVLRAGSGGGTFHGVVAGDGKSMSGDFVTAEGEHSLPFSLTRTGDAKIAPAPKSAPIGKELEGTWNGTLEVGGKEMRIVLRMANQPDGTAAGTIKSLDGSGVEIPIGITQKGTSVTIDVPSIGGSYAGVLNAEGTEMTGTWTQGPEGLPLTFRRAAR